MALANGNDIHDGKLIEIPHLKCEDHILDEYVQCLQTSFGHLRFREMQRKIISSILDGARDNCAIMATGYGKSLCYQFPSVYLDTITIVVSPFISLMQDQVLALTFYNIRACFLCSEVLFRNPELRSEVIDRKYNIVYVTPEYITSVNGICLLESIREHLTLIAIDEAHCISKWGHDFRQSYRDLHKLRDLCPAVPILATTATATEQVRNDIIKSLNLRNAQIVTNSLDRPNLEFIVKQKTVRSDIGQGGVTRTTDVWKDIGPYIEDDKTGSIIVYCLTKSKAEEVAAVIKANGQLCDFYHSGVMIDRRKQILTDFLHDRIRVVVATVAFNISKPDVRLVIHYGIPMEIEWYYQQVGRAGRDAKPAKCLMLFDEDDWNIIYFIKETQDGKPENYENDEDTIRGYLKTTQCRRRFLLSYFKDDCGKLSVRPDCCDNCRRVTSSLISTNNLSETKPQLIKRRKSETVGNEDIMPKSEIDLEPLGPPEKIHSTQMDANIIEQKEDK